MFGTFINAPQVGDVILSGDDEKIGNIVKMLTAEMNKRKKLFITYNGNYQDYIKLSGRTLANIIVAINSIEVMTEVYPEQVDRLINVIREGSKYGITFVLTTTSQNSIKFKIAQCFKQIMCLRMQGESDYRDILGRTDGLVPSKMLGRGLVKLERICEFQTASIALDENKFTTVKSLIDNLNKMGVKQAKKVPVMPEIITLDRFVNKYSE